MCGGQVPPLNDKHSPRAVPPMNEPRLDGYPMQQQAKERAALGHAAIWARWIAVRNRRLC